MVNPLCLSVEKRNTPDAPRLRWLVSAPPLGNADREQIRACIGRERAPASRPPPLQSQSPWPVPNHFWSASSAGPYGFAITQATTSAITAMTILIRIIAAPAGAAFARTGRAVLPAAWRWPACWPRAASQPRPPGRPITQLYAPAPPQGWPRAKPHQWLHPWRQCAHQRPPAAPVALCRARKPGFH